MAVVGYFRAFPYHVALFPCSTNITKFFLKVMGELKIAQLKCANTLLTNMSIGGEGQVCMIAK